MADECDNLPFALALCGALVRDRVPWADLLDALREADLRFIEKALPNYPHHNVIRSLHVSVEVLGREDAQAVASYQALAIFPKDEPVPEAAVLTLWTTDGMREREARKLLGVLERKALLRLDGEMPRRRVSLHPLQADYLRATAGDLARLHEKLLHAYAQSCHGQWSAGPNDGYFFEHLPWHLAQARRQPEHTDLLLDFDWLRTKLHFCEITAVLADFDAINDERGVRQIEGALRLAAHILAVDKAQLPSQLYGRLMHEELPEIQKLLSQIRNWNGAIWLRPLTPVLKQPGGPLLRTLREGTGDVMDLALTPDAQHLISWARDGTIKMWNFATGAEESLLPENSIGDKLRSEDNQQDQVLKLKRILNSHSIGVKVFALTPDGRRGVSASEDGTITVWNLDIDSEERSFKGYEHMVSGIVVTPDGRQAVTAHSYHPTLHTWDLERGVEKCRLEGHNGPINKVVITPDGKRAISASGDGTVRIWDLTVDCPGISRVGHEASITALSVTKDGRFALSGSANSVKVWELSTGKEKNTLAIEGTVRAFMLAGSAWEAVIEEENGTLAVWDLTMCANNGWICVKPYR